MWDYTNLAKYYDNRPNYSSTSIKNIIQLTSPANICDIGAGTGMLSIALSQFSNITAIEPNDAMLEIGLKKQCNNIKWIKGCAEDTKCEQNYFDLITFGSSFNVCDKNKALKECQRILKPNKWIALLWNHRNLNDPIQSKIEEIIFKNVNNFKYGSRRENQTEFLSSTKLFSEITYFENNFVFNTNKTDQLNTWKSHATLIQQAGDKFENILNEIAATLPENLAIEYKTVVWLAKMKE